jgi:hypothetical protein
MLMLQAIDWDADVIENAIHLLQQSKLSWGRESA